MNLSEIIISLLIYSGLIFYFLVPSKLQQRISATQKEPSNQIHSSNIKALFLQKNAILVPIIIGFTNYCIWAFYKAQEQHVNEHSGYAPISYTDHAVQSMLLLNGYTLLYIVLLSFFITQKINKMRMKAI